MDRHGRGSFHIGEGHAVALIGGAPEVGAGEQAARPLTANPLSRLRERVVP